MKLNPLETLSGFRKTSKFADEDYLATEINYAIAEKRTKKERFSIITLLFRDEKGEVGQVPELLKQYVWKEHSTLLEALRQLITALPVEVGSVHWKV